MRLVARLFIAAAVASVPAGLAVMSCGTDAAGIDACRQIESTRCNAAQACKPGFDVTSCLAYYHDECLVGLQNEDGGDPPQAAVTACTNAINAVAACQTGGKPLDAGCGVAIDTIFPCGDAGPGATLTACDLILVCPEVLASCSFIATPPLPDAGEASDAGDGGDGDTDAAQ